MPADGKYSSVGRDVLVDHGTLWRLDLVNSVGVMLHDLAAGIHVCAVELNRVGSAAERRRRMRRKPKQQRGCNSHGEPSQAQSSQCWGAC